MSVRVLALLWGFAEATLFFLVPDILLSWLSLRAPRRLPSALAMSLVGALGGGALSYVYAKSHSASAIALLDYVPGIHPALIASAQASLLHNGPLALLIGAFSGTPYKLFAAQAASVGMSLPLFVAASIPARLTRWLLLVVVVFYLARFLRKHLSEGLLTGVFILAWSINYVIYFYLMGF